MSNSGPHDWLDGPKSRVRSEAAARCEFAHIAWAAPTTLVGLVAGTLTLATGGRSSVVSGCPSFMAAFPAGSLIGWVFQP